MSQRLGFDEESQPKATKRLRESFRVFMDWMLENKLRFFGTVIVTLGLAALACMLALTTNRFPESTGNLESEIGPDHAQSPQSQVEDGAAVAMLTVTPVALETTPIPTPEPVDKTPVPTVMLEPNVALARVRVISCETDICEIPLWQDYTREVLTSKVPDGTTVRVIQCFHPVELVTPEEELVEGEALILTPSAYTTEGLWCEVYTEEIVGDRIAKGMIQYWLLDFGADEEAVG